jgi:predicted MFS family arabinose efflux permease
MHHFYKIHKILHLKKELKEVYTNQVIENFALFLIYIFIPAYLMEIGYTLTEAVAFVLFQWVISAALGVLSARINARIGVKHTILLRSPILIFHLAIVMNIQGLPWLYWPAVILGGLSTSLYWVSFNTEYVNASDSIRKGEEAGLLVGLPYMVAVMGPLAGAAVLTLLGFYWLFAISVCLIFLSVVPLFLSRDYKTDLFRLHGIDLLMDKRRAIYYLVYGIIITTDFVFWSLHVFINYGFISLGIAASLVGLGMIIFTLMVGQASNTARGRRRVARIGAFLSAGLWLMRFLADSEVEFMLLSLIGGFVITSVCIPIYADFVEFAKRNGPSKSVVFRHFWLYLGQGIPALILVFAVASLGFGTAEIIRASFIMTALASLILVTFKK